MSLEQAITDLNASVQELIRVMQGATTVAEVRTIAKATDESSYFHDTAHNAVYKFGPTDPLNGVQARCERITAEQYATLKAKYSAMTEQVIAANPSQATAAASTQPTAPAVAAPASEPSTPATPETVAPSATAQADQASPATWEQVMAAAMTLVKKPATGQRHVQALLKEYGVGTVPKLKDLGKNAELLAKIAARQASDEGL